MQPHINMLHRILCTMVALLTAAAVQATPDIDRMLAAIQGVDSSLRASQDELAAQQRGAHRSSDRLDEIKDAYRRDLDAQRARREVRALMPDVERIAKSFSRTAESVQSDKATLKRLAQRAAKMKSKPVEVALAAAFDRLHDTERDALETGEVIDALEAEVKAFARRIAGK